MQVLSDLVSAPAPAPRGWGGRGLASMHACCRRTLTPHTRSLRSTLQVVGGERKQLQGKSLMRMFTVGGCCTLWAHPASCAHRAAQQRMGAAHTTGHGPQPTGMPHACSDGGKTARMMGCCLLCCLSKGTMAASRAVNCAPMPGRGRCSASPQQGGQPCADDRCICMLSCGRMRSMQVPAALGAWEQHRHKAHTLNPSYNNSHKTNPFYTPVISMHAAAVAVAALQVEPSHSYPLLSILCEVGEVQWSLKFGNHTMKVRRGQGQQGGALAARVQGAAATGWRTGSTCAGSCATGLAVGVPPRVAAMRAVWPAQNALHACCC